MDKRIQQRCHLTPVFNFVHIRNDLLRAYWSIPSMVAGCPLVESAVLRVHFKLGSKVIKEDVAESSALNPFSLDKTEDSAKSFFLLVFTFIRIHYITLLLTKTPERPARLQSIAQLTNWNWRKRSDSSATVKSMVIMNKQGYKWKRRT